MTHLSADQLFAIAFDQTPRDAETAAHLAACSSCTAELARLTTLAGELALARRSEPSAQALQRYAALYAQVQRRPAPLGALWQTVRAALTWDGRQQVSLLGVRSGAPARYRLLYQCIEAAVELLVEPEQSSGLAQANELRRLEGEIAAGADHAAPISALVQLLDSSGVAVSETVADPAGRFRMASVAPGSYRLLITLPDELTIESDPLEID
jgi:hypothetical protein